MKFNIDSKTIELFKKNSKRYNYMIDWLLSSVEDNLIKYSLSIINISSGKTIIVDINDDNCERIKDIFGEINDEIVEKIITIALMFPEV